MYRNHDKPWYTNYKISKQLTHFYSTVQCTYTTQTISNPQYSTVPFFRAKVFAARPTYPGIYFHSFVVMERLQMVLHDRQVSQPLRIA